MITLVLFIHKKKLFESSKDNMIDEHVIKDNK